MRDPSGDSQLRDTLDNLAGTALLLSLLGSLVVGDLIRALSEFLEGFLDPFSTNDPRDPSPQAVLLAILAYGGYVFNCFRQIHGIGVIAIDQSYKIEVLCQRSTAERVASFVSLFFVVIIPAILVSLVRGSDGIHQLLGFNPKQTLPLLVVFAYCLSAVSYLVWDRLTKGEITIKLKKILIWDARNYEAYTQNWANMAIYFLLIALASLLFCYVCKLSYQVLLLLIIFLTCGYTIFDYTVNRYFYFRPIGVQAGTMEKRHRAIVKVVVLVILPAIIMLLFYTARDATALAPAASVKAPSKVSLQLKWLYNAGFAGDLVAKERGFWNNLDVDIRPGGVGVDAIKTVLSGNAEFGVATGDQILLAAERGAPLVAIALVYQENPLAWIVKTASGIKTPSDLKGKRIGLTYIDDAPLFSAMMKKVRLKRFRF